MAAALKTVLMIEDNPADVEIIREELAMARGTTFTVETASNLADGLTYIGEHVVNGILLDLSLPDSHGLETFTRTREKAPELPIVVLTGNEDEELGLQAVREGAQDYIVKGHLKGSGLARAIEYAIERKVVDVKLRRAKELEAISHLSMGMVKDINNVLAVILINLQSLEWPLRNNDVLAGQVQAARRAVFYGANLTKRLSGLSTAESFVKKLVDVNELITNLADSLSNVAEKGTSIVTELASSVSPTLLDPLDLETALSGLVANARDSMSGGGKIVIRTETVTVAEGKYPENDVGPGSFVNVSVADIGVGMSETQKFSAIEPFFSTNPNAEGHGLGLSMVSGFVRRSGGFMRINSEEGTGTCVELFLPSADKSEQRTESESIDPLKAMANGETVLVLDSDSTVCEAIAMQLKELGYTALQADTPVTAMEMLETYLETKVVLLDILPSDKINGVSLAQELRANRSDLEVLFTSAHGRSTFKQNGIPGDVENVLFKPYRKSDLAKKLRELLDDQATL